MAERKLKLKPKYMPEPPAHAPREWVEDPERTARERRMPEVLDRIKDDITELKDEMKEQRNWFNNRLDRMDARMWGILIMCVTTMMGVIAKLLLDM